MIGLKLFLFTFMVAKLFLLVVAVTMALTLLYMASVYVTIALDQTTVPAMLLSFWLVACSLIGTWGIVRILRS